MGVVEIAGHRCVIADDDQVIGSVRDVADLVGEALGEDASVLVVPVSHLDPAFFDLRSGFAGEVLQKAANYRLKFAVVGDVSEHVAGSNAFRDLVVESNSSRDLFFVADMEALEGRLARMPA
jgi:hypothetical protein